MYDHDEGGAGMFGQSFEKSLQRLDAAGGSADSDDRRFRARLLRTMTLLFVRFAVCILGHAASPANACCRDLATERTWRQSAHRIRPGMILRRGKAFSIGTRR